jgi:1,4-dihydroxy-2-naphthoyl-CoA hydrolase
MIWFNDQLSLEDLATLGKGTMGEFIGIEFVELGENYIKATMPVDYRTIQPYGLLHGGASCVLAETVGSIASALVIDQTKFICVGLEINANHIRSTRNGLVTAKAAPLHLGKSTHVWDIRITDANDQLVCISRLTVAVLEKRH